MEKFSSIDGVVGDIPPEGKKEILAHFAEVFKHQDFKELDRVEKEKTESEKKMIDLANKITNKILVKYGADNFEIPRQNIHIIKESCWQDKENEATYFEEFQAVGMKERKSMVSFLEIAAHEMLHMKSRNLVHIPIDLEKSTDNIKEFSSGLHVIARGGKKEYFVNLNEAILEELIKREVVGLLNSDNEDKEIMETNKIKKYLSNGTLKDESIKSQEDIDDILYASFNDDKLEVDFFCYNVSRKMLQLLIDKIFENKDNLKNKDKDEFNIQTREDVFCIFASSMIRGDLRKVIKLIDHTFGFGTSKALNKIVNNRGEEDSGLQLEFIKRL